MDLHRPASRIARLLLLLVLGLSLLAQPVAAQQGGVTRLDGDGSAVGAAIAWSQLTFAAGAADQVLIARDDDFSDALTTGPVQRLLGAPLLLTDTDALNQATAEEINRLGADEATIVGGPDAVSEVVADQLGGLGLDVERVMGVNRLDTAVAVQRRFFPDTTDVAIARAFGTETDPTQAFADTIPLGAYAAIANTPVLLTDTDELSQPTADALAASSVERAIIVGGQAAVSDNVQVQLDGIDNGSSDSDTGITVRRAAGPNRFATATAIAADLGYATAADAGRVLLVEGQAEDAWTGGLPAAAQAGNDAPVVLANGDQLPAATAQFLTDTGVPLVCGPNVSAAACSAAAAAASGEAPPAPGPRLLDVTPSQAQTATVSTPGPLGGILMPEDDSDDLTYAATGLDPDQAYRVTLVIADNISVDDDGTATFVDDDGNGAADAGASEEVALITQVNGQAEPVNDGEGSKTVPAGDDDPTSPSGVFPDAEGTLSITLDGEAAGSVVPVFYVNRGASTFLEIDQNGSPVEAYGVGGAATYN